MLFSWVIAVGQCLLSISTLPSAERAPHHPQRVSAWLHTVLAAGMTMAAGIVLPSVNRPPRSHNCW